MDALTIIIMLILFVIAMIFVFSISLLIPYMGKRNIISVILIGLIVGTVGGTFLLSPIVDDIPDFSRTIIEENIEGTDQINMGLSTNRNITQLIENISSITGVQNVEYEGIEIRVDEPFETPAARESFFSRLKASNSAVGEVSDLGNNSYFIQISENGDPQSVLNSVYNMFSVVTSVHLRYTSMDANATVDANNVTRIMNSISNSGAVIHNISGPTEDQVAVINQYTPNKTDIVIISAITGLTIALLGFFIDSIFSFIKRNKKSKKFTTKDQIKRKNVPRSYIKNMKPAKQKKKKQTGHDSIDIFDDSFENSEKQELGSNRDFKELKETGKQKKQETRHDKKDRQGLLGIFKRKLKNKKSNKKEDNTSSKQETRPRVKPKRKN